MKYNAKPMNSRPGHWAVFTGKNFFLSSVTDNEQAAKEDALIRSMSFYQRQRDGAWDELVKSVKKNEPTRVNNYDDGLWLQSTEDHEDRTYNYTTMGDLMC